MASQRKLGRRRIEAFIVVIFYPFLELENALLKESSICFCILHFRILNSTTNLLINLLFLGLLLSQGGSPSSVVRQGCQGVAMSSVFAFALFGRIEQVPLK